MSISNVSTIVVKIRRGKKRNLKLWHLNGLNGKENNFHVVKKFGLIGFNGVRGRQFSCFKFQ